MRSCSQVTHSMLTCDVGPGLPVAMLTCDVGTGLPVASSFLADVPDVFRHAFQSYPLDLHHPSFYKSRVDSIHACLAAISAQEPGMGQACIICVGQACIICIRKEPGMGQACFLRVRKAGRASWWLRHQLSHGPRVQGLNQCSSIHVHLTTDAIPTIIECHTTL